MSVLVNFDGTNKLENSLNRVVSRSGMKVAIEGSKKIGPQP